MTIDLGELSDGQEKDDENKKSGGPGFMTLSYKLQITNYSYSNYSSPIYNDQILHHEKNWYIY